VTVLAHYADAVFSEPCRCWRFISSPDGSGRPDFCSEPVVWVGFHTLRGGRRIRVWSCEGHREGIQRRRDATVATTGRKSNG
jgi:hypothetical protein